jgi:hypothetical protein
MANEGDWVEDVRRWCLAGRQKDRSLEAPAAQGDGAPLDLAPDDVGYEAAHPVLQSQNWPDAPSARTES